MTSTNIEDTYPLTPLQEGMLFHTLHAPELHVYSEQLSTVLVGELDPVSFKRAWQHVMDRHPILRTAFAWKNLEKPMQVVGRRVGVPLEQQDWRGLAASEQEARLAAHLEEDRRRGFQLSKAPLMRLSLIQVADDEYRLVWSFHHLLLDGWSVGLVLKEFLTYYEAFQKGGEPRLERPRPYRDHIAWLQRQDVAQAQGFWKEALRGVTAPTPLPLMRKTLAQTEESLRYAERELELPVTVTAWLRALARARHLTLNTILQGAWALLLARYAGEGEVIFGATVSGRPGGLPGVEAMVGLFINTLPVRVRVRGDASLVPWLQELQAQQVEREQYAYSSLVEIQGWSAVPRGVPLFESLVVFENYPVDASLTERHDAIHIREFRAVERTKYPLTVVAAAPDAELMLKVSYDAAYFDAAVVIRLLGQLGTVLASMGRDPDQRLQDVLLLTEAERQQVVVEWNATETGYSKERCLHELFEEQVERSPEAIAVAFEEERLTYRALNARANQLAHQLRDLGVGPDVLVGLCVERSLELAVALLGVLKAGGAYVPLDPTYPRARLAFMAEDARPAVLLTQRKLLASLPAHSTVLCLDGDSQLVADKTQENPIGLASPRNLAYVIYTSGSTGIPKGVAVTHGNVTNHCTEQAENFGLCPQDRVLQFASISFDAAVEEIFPTWASGAALVLRPAGPLKSGREFEEFIRERGISVLNLPTAYWHEWVGECSSSGVSLPPCLRLVVVGGEEALADDVVRWRKLLQHDVAWINTYGPTETTVVTAFFRLDTSSEANVLSGVPLGRPLANTEAYVLDPYLNAVPVGVPGELYIGGLGVARGYLRRGGLTAERFLPHPFADGQRVYRTGDLVRWNERGELEFIGREDHQVKVRGHRIELGEVESALRAHAGVNQAVVVLREDLAGEKRLVAYVTAAGGEALTDALLREHLKERLPHYLVPSVVMSLEAFPLTPNGKVDRRQLPVPEARPKELEYEAPCTELEGALARIWAEVLRVPRVGVRDNFFELGGHSLTSVRLCHKVHLQLGRELPLNVLFARPTVRDVARWMAEQVRPADSFRIPLRTGRGAEHMLAFLPTMLGSGVHFNRLVQKLSCDCAMSTCRVPGTMPGEEPRTSIEEIAAHCRQQLIHEGEYREWSLLGWSFGGVLAYEMARQMLAEGLPVRRVVLVDSFLAAASTGSDVGAAREQSERTEFDDLFATHDMGAHGADMEAAFAMYRANLTALRRYEPQPCRLPVIDIRAERVLGGPGSSARAGPPVSSLSDQRSVVRVPGDHYSVFSPEYLGALARAVSTAVGSDDTRAKPRLL